MPVTFTGIDALIRSFQVLPSAVAAETRAELDPVWRDLKGSLAAYPAERPGQRYRRTGDLGRGWTSATPRYIVRGDGSIDARIENPADYTEDVQGDSQMAIFRGRWTLASTILTEYEQDITIAVERGCANALKRAGLA